MYNIFQAIANYLSKTDEPFSLREKVAEGRMRGQQTRLGGLALFVSIVPTLRRGSNKLMGLL
jgi:hypothetical protein